MLDMLKQEGGHWAIIAACKGAKEEIKAFEKKVKTQFGMVPFEDITPVPAEVDLEKVEKDKKKIEEETAKAKGIKEIEDQEKKDKEEKEFKEKLAKEKGLQTAAKEDAEDESWGTVVETSLDPSENGDSMDATVPLETPVKSDNKVIADETVLDETLPLTPKATNGAESNGDLKRKEKPKAGPASKVSKLSDVEDDEKLEAKEGSDEEESEDSSKEEISNNE